MKMVHILVIPYPVQGHVLPLMNFSKILSQHGFKITFVNTEFNHNLIIDSSSSSHKNNTVDGSINLVSIPDGLESPEDRTTPGKLSQAVLTVLPEKFEELIDRIDKSPVGCDKISCVLADQSLGWALDIAEKHGIKRAAFCPAAAASLVLGLNIQKLIDDQIIHLDGTLRRSETIKLSPSMPEMNPSEFVWTCLKNKDSQRNTFKLMVQNNESLRSTDWLVCNTSQALEPGACALASKILPVGPICGADLEDKESVCRGSFLSEDESCIGWLDQCAPGSVIYVAFGSFEFMGEAQLTELALGLELTNRPFLWVTRTNPTNKLHLISKTAPRGKLVRWAPQREILSHPSVGCFLSHCGWNSTMEGLAGGLPFLCWPVFADQFINRTYICNVWKTGLALERDKKTGTVSGWEIKNKVDMVMGDEEIKKRVMCMKELVLGCVKNGGSSHENLKKFVEWIKN